MMGKGETGNDVLPMRPPGWGRSAVVVFGQEIRDCLRSKLAIVLVLLYLAVSAGSTMFFLHVITKARGAFHHGMRQATQGQLDADVVLQNPTFIKNAVYFFVKDRELADVLVSMPLMAVFFGWFIFTWLPWLAVLGTAPRVAEEVAIGSARFVAFRVTRSAWVFGKFLAQAAILAVAAVLSAVAVWGVSWYVLDTFQGMVVARAMVPLVWKGWVAGLAFVGLALGISQVFRGPWIAMLVSFAGVCGMSILNLVADPGRSWRYFRALVPFELFTPQPWRTALWSTNPERITESVLVLLLLCLIYSLLGHFVLSRRNL